MNIDMINNLTNDEKELFSIIKEVVAKYTPSSKVFAVGGWTRDKLLGIDSDDIDVMIDNMAGEDFAKLVTQHMSIKDPHIIRENPEKSKHITTAKAHIPLSSGTIQEVDFAQARKEVYTEGSRIPEITTATPEEDAYRRDLTINSVFYDILNNKITDFTNRGIEDLKTMTIKTPLDPIKTFTDDPLRIFRTIRFAAKYDGKIDPETYKAMQDPSLREMIKIKLSKERIGIEFVKMLKNQNAEEALQLLKDTGLWQDILTEALKGTQYEGKMADIEMEQNNPHHTLNVWGHSMQVVKNILNLYPEAEPEKRTTMILAALMHDLGKLYYEIHGESKSYPGRASYHGHEKESKEISEHILRYLKIEPFIQEVSKLAQFHMRPHKFTEGNEDSIRSMRRFIRRMGEESLNWIDVLNLAIADAYSKGLEINPQTIQSYQELERKLQEAMTSIKPLNDGRIPPILNGNEVMEILNIKPGAWMSEIMEFVKELKDENPNITKEEAIQKLKDKYENVDISTIKQEAQNKDNKNKDIVCPMHLFNKKNKEIHQLLKDNHHYEVFSILQELKNEYEDDDKVTRLIAINMLTLLLQDKNYRNRDLIQYIFSKAEENFFDTILCSFVFGILLLLETETSEKVITEIGNRMIKMSPGTLKMVLNMLPKNINQLNIKNEFEKKLNENT